MGRVKLLGDDDIKAKTPLWVLPFKVRGNVD
jgi:hypothetical protein